MLDTARETPQHMPSQPGRPGFEVQVRKTEARNVVFAVGELDVAVTSELDDAVRRHLPDGPVVLDLAQLTFMDSSGLRVLDGLLRDADRHGWELTLRSELQRPVRQLLTITGMFDVMPFEEEDGA